MLAEWLTHVFTPCPSHLRRMGYLREIIGTKSRHRRCHRAWAPHLERTKETILQAADRSQPRRKAVILGSGLLYDVPLAALAAMFEDVVLLDIFHMPTVKRRSAGFPNVRLISHDLSGVVDRLSRSGPVRFTPTPCGDLPEIDADLIVSANVSSQIPHLPAQCLARLKPDLGEAELQEFAATIVHHHLAQLEQARGTVCLITEIEHRRMDGDREIARIDPLFGVDPGRFDREWMWPIAPHPEIHPREDVVYRVGARITDPG